MPLLVLYAITFVAWGGLALRLRRAEEHWIKRSLPALYTLAAVIALIFIATPPVFSSDSYRYLWDGGLLLKGLNPYTATPDGIGPVYAPELFDKLDWKDQHTVYPPLAQLLFAAAYGLYDLVGLWAGKLVFAAGAIVALWFLYRLLPLRLFILALLNPLLLFEAFNGAHLDAWVIALLLGTYYFFQRERYALSSLFLAGAILIKLYPVIFVPLFMAELWRRQGLGRATVYGGLCVALVAICFAPLVPHLPFLLERYASWVQEMVFNASLYAIFASSLVSFGVLAAGILYLIRLPLSPGVLLSVSLLFIVSSSVVYPWYTLVALPFLILFVAENPQRYWLLYACALLQLLFSLTYINVYLLYTIPFEPRMTILSWIAVAEYSTLAFVAYWALYKEKTLPSAP